VLWYLCFVELMEEYSVCWILTNDSEHLTIHVDSSEGIVSALLPLHLEFDEASKALPFHCSGN